MEENNQGFFGKRLVIESTVELLKEAQAEKKRWLSSSPASLLRDLALESLKVGKGDQAKSFCEAALKLDSTIFDHIDMDILAGKDKTEQRLLDFLKSTSTSYLELAMEYLESNKVVAALLTLEKQLALDPNCLTDNTIKVSDSFLYNKIQVRRPFDAEEIKKCSHLLGVEICQVSNAHYSLSFISDSFKKSELEKLNLNFYKSSSVFQRSDKVLHLSVRLGCLEIIRWLVAHKEDVNQVDEWGWTSLGIAASAGQLEVVRYLHEDCEIDIDQMQEKVTPLNLAIEAGHLEVVKYLVENGTDISFIGKGMYVGMTAFLWAARCGQHEIVKYFIACGEDISQTTSGFTALMIASRDFAPKVVKCLIESGANVNYANEAESGETALMLACNLEVVKILVEHEANVNLCGKYGTTALMGPSNTGDLDVVKYLVEHGADVNHVGDALVSGWKTALQHSLHRNHLDVAKYLLSQGAIATEEQISNLSDKAKALLERAQQELRDEESVKQLPKHSVVAQSDAEGNNNNKEGLLSWVKESLGM